jgi:hypothetical protein
LVAARPHGLRNTSVQPTATSRFMSRICGIDHTAE